jgi:uncharacterized protein DUF6585
MTGETTAEELVRQRRPGAEAGDPPAMVGLAWALLQLGNDAEAELWYARAADAGNVEGMTGLGYVLNRKGAKDEAVGWWRRAAGGGEVHAMRNLAGVLRGNDRPEGERWGWLAEAAGRDVAKVTLPDEVAEAAADLGPLRSAIGDEKGTERGTNVGCLILGAVVGVALAVIGLVMTGSASGWAIGFLVVGVLVVLLTLVLVLGSWNDAPRRIWQYEGGLVYRDEKGRLDVLRWADVRVLRDITRNYRNGHYTNTTFRYTLRHKDGHEVVLQDLFFPRGQLCVLGEEIEREITAVRLPRALTALQQGQRLEFGSLAVDITGISDGRDHLPWREVESIDTKDGKVRVKRAGRWLNWSSTRVSSVPDVFVLLALADALRAVNEVDR